LIDRRRLADAEEPAEDAGHVAVCGREESAG
jgi:hypothetical protein